MSSIGSSHFRAKTFSQPITLPGRQVYLNGEETHVHGSYSGSTFNTLNVAAAGIGTVMLEAVELDLDEWISLVEVSFCSCRCRCC